jgi:hypothetical protein
MKGRHKIAVSLSVLALGGGGLMYSQPQQPRLPLPPWAEAAASMIGLNGDIPFRGEDERESVPHAECSFFGAGGERFRPKKGEHYNISRTTERVAAMLGLPKRVPAIRAASATGTIDTHLFAAMEAAGVAPAAKSDDFTFIRRASLDLTGRVPQYERLVQFINDASSEKRKAYVDELLASAEWVDKWAMFFGDLYKNAANNNQVNRYPEGRNAFHNYIQASLAANKPYNVLASELISATGTNSWDHGELNWIVGGNVQGGERGKGHDNYDQMASNTAETFLGIAHLDCVLCHDGRRHLDELSLWGKSAIRLDAWGLSAFFSKTVTPRTVVSTQPIRTYYAVQTNPRLADYPLNTTTGNRPPRQPIGSITSVAPEYPFGERPKPEASEPYRAALARFLTADFQFARATVNYFWKEFFGIGLVEPVNQFDPARLDPDNPPAAPWTLQPSHPRLLNALAQDFIDSGYDLKALMRAIVNSEAYQLSATYHGEWKAEWEPLYARKYVRRLWAEEIADAISQTSNVPFTYQIGTRDAPVTVSWAMQLPETRTLPGGAMGSFLNSFFRGNRVDDFRRSDGSIAQALNLMNDNFVHQRTRASGSGEQASLARQLLTRYPTSENELLVVEMFATVLIRVPNPEERAAVVAVLNAATTNATRQARVEDLLWTLYNKVDFLFNY